MNATGVLMVWRKERLLAPASHQPPFMGNYSHGRCRVLPDGKETTGNTRHMEPNNRKVRHRPRRSICPASARQKWFRQPESNQHYMVRSHVPYPLNDGGMKRCPFQLGTGWRRTGATPTLLPLGVDNTVVGSLQSPPRWGGLPVPYSFAVNCKLLCDHQTLLSPISRPSADALILWHPESI